MRGLGLHLGIGAAGHSSFTPVSRPLATWFRGDSVHLTSGNVDTWIDKSGNGRDATQIVAGQRPLLIAADAAYNNKPTLQFVSTGSNCLSQAVFGAPVAQPSTIYVVCEYKGSVGQTIYDEGLGASHRTLLNLSAGGAWQSFAGAVLVGSSVTTKRVIACVYNSVSSAIYENNSTTATASGDAGTNSCDGLSLGSFQNSASFLDGKIAEFVWVTNADNLAQRQQMFTYLGGEYAIAVT